MKYPRQWSSGQREKHSLAQSACRRCLRSEVSCAKKARQEKENCLEYFPGASILPVMKKTFLNVLNRYKTVLLFAGGLGFYLVASGTSGSCGACATLTGSLGFPSLLSSAQAAPPEAAAEKFLKKGDALPDTRVLTETGQPVRLRDLVKEKPSVLIFYRGGWCPYCTEHLSALAEIEKDILAAGHQILAISPDQPSKLTSTPDRAKLGYRLFSDSSMETAKAFGITFQVPDDLVKKYKNDYRIDIEAASGKTHHLLPHPAVYIVDTDGVIRFAHVNEDYKVRLEPDKILKALAEP